MPFDEPVTLSVSRAQLYGAAVSGDAIVPELELARRTVHAPVYRSAVYLLSRGSVRRVDAWFAGDDLLLHSYSPDQNDIVAGSTHRGGAAVLAWSQLLSARAPAKGPHDDPGAAEPLTFESLDRFIEWFAGSDDDDEPQLGEQTGIVAIIGPTGGNARGVARLDGAATRWGEAEQGDELTLSRGGLADLWTRLSSPFPSQLAV